MQCQLQSVMSALLSIKIRKEPPQSISAARTNLSDRGLKTSLQLNVGNVSILDTYWTVTPPHFYVAVQTLLNYFATNSVY